MYKCELLAPAGKIEAIQPLIDAGADAIYVGLSGFSSRPKSSDFSVYEIKTAVDMCHQNDVRLYVAINGCISQQSVAGVYNYLQQLDEIGVDAFIIADWGILNEARLYINHAEIHASTLLGAYNARTIRYLRQIGVSRIVLSTNLYMDEIASIISSVPEMDFELVADGGICFNDNRICELPHKNEGKDYTVYCRQNYMLCVGDDIIAAKQIAARQITSSEVIDMYLEIGIFSYKIEGRTVAYQFIIPRVKKLRKALDESMAHEHTKNSTLHYIQERHRTEAEL